MDSRDIDNLRRVAEVMANAARLNATIAGMQAAAHFNIIYPEEAYEKAIADCECGVNAVMTLLRDFS